MSVVPRVLIRNWRLKLAALGLAVFLWAVVRTAPDSTTTTMPARVAVNMSGSPALTVARPPDPAMVELHLRGSLADIERLRQRGATVSIPLGEVSGGDTVVNLRTDWATVEGGISVDRIEPVQVHLSFEDAVTAVKPITLRPTGELPERHALAQPLSLNPVVARVRGPASLVEAVDSIPTMGPDLSRIDESGVYEVPLDTAGYPGLSFTVTSASVGIRLEPAVVREEDAVPVVIAGTPGEVPVSELSIDPPLVAVTLRGGRTRVSQAEVPELIAEVDSAFVQTMVPGEVRVVPVRLRGVPRLVEATARPDSVTVRRRMPGEGGEEGGSLLFDPGGGP